MSDDTDEVIEVWIPTTETLSLEDLRTLADGALLTFDTVQDLTISGEEHGGIHFLVRDEQAARYWRDRGALWGTPDYPTPSRSMIPKETEPDE